jgi:hypothetical protein
MDTFIAGGVICGAGLVGKSIAALKSHSTAFGTGKLSVRDWVIAPTLPPSIREVKPALHTFQSKFDHFRRLPRGFVNPILSA